MKRFIQILTVLFFVTLVSGFVAYKSGTLQIGGNDSTTIKEEVMPSSKFGSIKLAKDPIHQLTMHDSLFIRERYNKVYYAKEKQRAMFISSSKSMIIDSKTTEQRLQGYKNGYAFVLSKSSASLPIDTLKIDSLTNYFYERLND